MLEMWVFRKLGIIGVSSNKDQKIVLTNSIVFVVQKILQ